MIERISQLTTYRELAENLIMRNLKVRYKNSVLGFLWSLLNPLLLMLVFTVVFTFMLPAYHVPNFPVFVLCALIPWNFFSTSVMSSIDSITQNGNLIRKVYFPREILTISSVLSNFVNFALSVPVLLLFIILFRTSINYSIFYLPFIMLVQLIFTIGIGLFLATLNVFYRDTAVIMEVIMQAWFFFTPVFYPIDLLPESQTLLGLTVPVRRLTYILNPMASIVASYRSILYGFIDGSPPTAPALDFLLRTAVTSLLCLLAGYSVFIRYNHRFAEEV